MKHFISLFLSTMAFNAFSLTTDQAVNHCYNAYVHLQIHYRIPGPYDPYAPQATGISLCRVLLEHRDQDPLYDWAFYSARKGFSDLSDFDRAFDTKEGACKLGGVLYLKKFYKQDFNAGIKMLNRHCKEAQ